MENLRTQLPETNHDEARHATSTPPSLDSRKIHVVKASSQQLHYVEIRNYSFF
jgi:hypothetical protein